MSKFTTTLPVNADLVVKAMPEGSILNSTRLGDDGKSLVLEWENETLRTPFTVPVEIAPDVVLGKSPWPETVKVVQGFKRVQNAPVAPEPSGKVKKSK